MTVICIECGLEFDRPRKSKRQTCSRACWAAFGWKKNPDKRIASIKAALTTPESRARSTEINNRRWAIPGARAKLSAWNRDRWADPATAAALGLHPGLVDPERRAAFLDHQGAPVGRG